LSLFDVSDIANPVRTAIYTVDNGDDVADSVADADHHAFSYFPAQGILAFPVREYSYTSGYQARTEVVRVDPENGFTRLGGLLHPGYNWSGLRAVRVGQVLFSISDEHVLIAELAAPDTILKQIDL
jgi:hypothetical protein